jgi:hypothetical protein
LETGPSQRAIGWAGSALILTVGIAVVAKIAGVILLPGARGIAGEATINILDAASGALAYTLTALLVALVCSASFELARSRAVHVVARGAVVATSGLIVALASPAVVERLSALPSVVLAVIASLVALVAGAAVVRAPQTRAIGGVLVLLAICGLLRVVAWETSATAFERLSLPLHDVARGFSTVAVALQAIAALIAAAWIGTRSRWHGRILANLAILVAFGATWLASQTSEAPSRVEAVLRASLSGATGLPPPYLLGSIAAFLVPASILLTIAALAQPGQPPPLVAALGLGLLSHGAFDVPLQALLVTTSAQWAMLAMADERSLTAPVYPERASGLSAPAERRVRPESA